MRSIQLSKKMSDIKPSATVMLGQKARDLSAQGKDIIQLGEGEPDFNTPDFIIEAAFKAARQGATKYTSVSGTKELRDQVVKKFQNDNGIIYQNEEIVIGNGAKQLIFNALLVSLNPGDQVIIPAPYWVSYPQMVKIADGEPIIVTCNQAQNFKITPELIENSLSTKTRWILLNSPGNPTGAVYNKDELSAIAEVLRKNPNVGIMCDDIYEKVIFEDQEFYTMAQVAPDLSDKILTVNGVSKAYAMTGWRIGYAGGHKDLIASMIKLQGQSTTNASSIGQAAALEALRGNQQFLEEWKLLYEKRRDLISSRLSGIFPSELSKPQGAFYYFLSCKNFLGTTMGDGRTLKDDIDFCDYLLEDFGVAVVPGSEFGCAGYFRLCFAKSEEKLIDACRRIIDAVMALKNIN